MAVDEAILEAAARQEVLPTLRLYAWDPPCLSLGHAQPFSDVDLDRLHKLGWDLVRRPTGGRAILHTDELTYAVIGPQDDPRLAGGVLESYRRLAQALVSALHLLGAPAQINSSTKLSSHSEMPQPPVCFEAPSDYEITINGKKLMGSAQARKQGCLLQHGSLPLTGDITRITWVLNYADEPARNRAAQHLSSRATTLASAIQCAIEWSSAAEAFAQAFTKTLNLNLIPAELTATERQRASELVEEKYGHPDWSRRI